MIRLKIALYLSARLGRKRVTTMTFFWALLALVLHVLPGAVAPTHAQGTRKDDIVFNSRGIPLAGATVRVCTMPASGQPCTPLALIYSDSGLTQALANPTTTDGLGNYFFYAAPGQYEIEISGPSITTKQLPNVILPNDPSSPTFSGAVSAFSLTLGGNLTVSGSTTVVGALASGTLTLNNQNTPPGAAGTGTVNLYTKTADMRLYYKDQTGTEIGPLGPGNGAQINVANTFTAPQNIAADFHTKGPNPSYDIMLFGGYEYSGTQPTTTGTIAASSTSLTLASAQDFATGQGILVLGAGPATLLSTPASVAASPVNVTGSTTYNYCVVAEDYANGRTACSPAGSTTTGASSLGLFTAGTIASCTRASGVVTCTTTSAHHLSPGSFVEIQAGTTGGFLTYEGTATLVTASGSTFTFDQFGVFDDPVGITQGTLRVLAQNLVQWTEVDYSVLRSYIYRCMTTCTLPANAANYSLAGVTQGMDGGFLDYGYAISPSLVGNGDVPATAPTAPNAQWLSSLISAGGGTTTLTLAKAASTSVSGAITLHDNVPNIVAACATIGSTTGGGILYIPNSTPSGGIFPINSTLNLGTACNFGGQFEIDVAAPEVLANASVIPRNQFKLKGITAFGHVTNFYSMEPTTDWTGNAYPFIYALPGTSHDWSMDNLIFQAFRPYQADIVQDQDGTGNNVTSIFYRNIHLNANLAPSYIAGGGFGFFWERGGWSAGGATSFAAPPAAWFKGNFGLGRTVNSQLPGILYTDKTYVFGGILLDDAGNFPLTSVGVGHMEFKELLAESSYGPMIRAKLHGNTIAGIYMFDPTYADSLGASSTPLLDFTSAAVSGFVLQWPGCGNGNQPMFQVGSSAASYIDITLSQAFANCSIVGLQSYIVNQNSFVNTPVFSSGAGGQLSYQMQLPGPPSTAVSSGGSVPVGTILYSVSAVDANGNQTSVGPAKSAVTTTGNQTVTITPPTLPTGAIGWVPYRSTGGGAAMANIPGCSYIVGSTPFVDNFGFPCGASVPSSSQASSSSLSANGLTTYQLKLTNSFTDIVLPAPLTANRTQILPDVTGIVPVSSYVNSAYDNATRANGAIGSNWIVEQNGVNIASNQIQGTSTGVNSAFWNASSFATSQFAQATITALNGTTDFPGVSVLASGTGSSSTYYDCLENSTNIYIQRVVNAAAANLTNAASTGAVGDLLRLEIAPGGALTCYKNGAVALTFTDTQITSGAPGLSISGNVASVKNWSGGNLHPLGHLDAEQDWTKTQHYTQGVGFGTETFTASPRGEQNVFLPGALSSTWTGSTWTLDKAVTVTRVQVQVKTPPAGCSTNAVVRLTDGTSPVNVSISAGASDSGPITQNYAGAASLTISVQTAAAGCTTSPADANVVVQYRMQ